MGLGDFSAQAESYRTARPTYPALLIDLLVADAGISPGDAVADLGAGTGILTRMLVERAFVVTAIEPNEQMRKQADVPEARWINGTLLKEKWIAGRIAVLGRCRSSVSLGRSETEPARNSPSASARSVVHDFVESTGQSRQPSIDLDRKSNPQMRAGLRRGVSQSPLARDSGIDRRFQVLQSAGCAARCPHVEGAVSRSLAQPQPA